MVASTAVVNLAGKVPSAIWTLMNAWLTHRVAMEPAVSIPMEATCVTVRMVGWVRTVGPTLTSVRSTSLHASVEVLVSTLREALNVSVLESTLALIAGKRNTRLVILVAIILPLPR